MDENLIEEYVEKLQIWIEDNYQNNIDSISCLKTDITANLLNILELKTYTESAMQAMLELFKNIDSTMNGITQNFYSKRLCCICCEPLQDLEFDTPILHYECDNKSQSCADCIKAYAAYNEHGSLIKMAQVMKSMHPEYDIKQNYKFGYTVMFADRFNIGKDVRVNL